MVTEERREISESVRRCGGFFSLCPTLGVGGWGESYSSVGGGGWQVSVAAPCDSTKRLSVPGNQLPATSGQWRRNSPLSRKNAVIADTKRLPEVSK